MSDISVSDISAIDQKNGSEKKIRSEKQVGKEDRPIDLFLTHSLIDSINRFIWMGLYRSLDREK